MADVDDLFNLFDADNDDEDDAGNVPIVVEETDDGKSESHRKDSPALAKE